jgi:hypothetical protein
MTGRPPLYNVSTVMQATIEQYSDPCEAGERPSRFVGFCCFPGLLDGKGGN